LHRQPVSSSQNERFFVKAVKDEKEALNHLKKTTAMAISTILYYRGFFPVHDYGVRVHGRTNLFILDRNARTPGAKEVIDSIKNVFEAIEKKYLKTLVVGLIDDPEDTDSFLEGYVFRFNYNLNQFNSTSDVGEEAMKLIEGLKKTCKSLKLFKRKVYLTFKISYFDDMTPRNYQPKGFVDGGSTFTYELQAEDPKTFHAGKMTVGNNSMKVRADVNPDFIIREK
jgi:hypothetical protein